MKESMPDVSFERSMNHNYMILSKCSFFGMKEDQDRDYRTKMLLGNRIPGLLPVTHRRINGESRYYYEINSLQSLDRLYAKTEIRYEELRRLISGCVTLFDRLEEYLLDGTQIIMKPELIYMDVEKMEPYFVCYPDYEGDVRLSFMELIDGLLTRIDHTDERAVMLGYQIYRYTRNPNYVVSELRNMMDHVIVNMVGREMDFPVNEAGPSKETSYHPANASGDHAGKSHVQYRCMNRTDVEEPAGNAACLAEIDCGDKQDIETLEKSPGGRMKSIGDLAGGIFCALAALCFGTVILGARLIHLYRLDRNKELYLFGAMAAALMAAVLFFVCHVNRRRQNKDSSLPEDDNDEGFQYYTAAAESCDTYRDCCSQPTSMPVEAERIKGSAETVYLGDGVVEERVLYGRIDGREVHISLDRLPMTVGKLANVSDLVINDAAVSKMHARFEEHEGRVYVCDLNSTNGTARNGVLLEVNQSVALEPGDRLRFGKTYLTYC